MVHGSDSGHPGSSLGYTRFFTALYFKIMKHDPHINNGGRGEDILTLSNGHISPVYYSTLARSGYFDIKKLASFPKLNSPLQSHPAIDEHLSGARIDTRSSGQGVRTTIGVALAKRLNNDDTVVFSLHGDGESDERQVWEVKNFYSTP
jgi:transketolase